MNPHQLIPLYLSQSLFGLLYAIFIHWLSVNGYLKGHTAWSVVVGNAGVLVIQTAFFPEAWTPLMTLGSFAFSGVWMVLSYFYRYEKKRESESHKARTWPTNAKRVRETINLELDLLIGRLEGAANDNQVTAGFLLGVTNKLHELKGVLNSV